MAKNGCATATDACVASLKLGLKRSGSYGEVGGPSVSGYIGIALSVDNQALGMLIAASAQITGVDQRGASRTQLGHKCVTANVLLANWWRATECGLKGARGYREVGGFCEAGHVGVARAIYSQAEGIVRVASPEVGGIDDSGAGRVELGPGAAEGRRPMAAVVGASARSIVLLGGNAG